MNYAEAEEATLKALGIVKSRSDGYITYTYGGHRVDVYIDYTQLPRLSQYACFVVSVCYPESRSLILRAYFEDLATGYPNLLEMHTYPHNL